jgi:hypothetical protein
MAKTIDYMGLGVPAGVAQLMQDDVVALTAVGTGQTTGPTVGAYQFLVDLTTASGATACTLPAAPVIGSPYNVVVSSATTALVFPPSGGTIQGGSSNASFSVAQNKVATFIPMSATRWVATLSA